MYGKKPTSSLKRVRTKKTVKLQVIMSTLKLHLEARFVYDGSVTSLKNLLKFSGIKYRKHCNQRFLCESLILGKKNIFTNF